MGDGVVGPGAAVEDQVDLTTLRLPILGPNHMVKKVGDLGSGAVQALELGLDIWQGIEGENESLCLANRSEGTTAGLATATTTKVVTNRQAGRVAHHQRDMRALGSVQHQGDNVLYALRI